MPSRLAPALTALLGLLVPATTASAAPPGPPAPAAKPAPPAKAVAPARPAGARAPRVHQLIVKSPPRLEISTFEAAIVVRRGKRDMVKIVADLRGGPDGGELEIRQRGDAISIEGLDPGVTGTVTIESPPGTRFELETVVGALDLAGAGGRAELEAVSGSVSIDGIDEVEIEAVSGKVDVRNATRIEVHSVSGGVSVAHRGSAPSIELESVSGALDVRGGCGAGCRVRIESLSGGATLALDRRSSFRFGFETFSGALHDGLGMILDRPDGDDGERDEGGERDTSARYGKAEGSIQIETFSGTVRLAPPAR
jgi:hypothetical protein